MTDFTNTTTVSWGTYYCSRCASYYIGTHCCNLELRIADLERRLVALEAKPDKSIDLKQLGDFLKVVSLLNQLMENDD